MLEAFFTNMDIPRMTKACGNAYTKYVIVSHGHKKFITSSMIAVAVKIIGKFPPVIEPVRLDNVGCFGHVWTTKQLVVDVRS